MKSVFISLLALCALFMLDMAITFYTAEHKRKVRQYRERRYTTKNLMPCCVFVDFTCPKCQRKQSTAIEHDVQDVNVLKIMQHKIKRCPNCGISLKWVD